MPIFVRVPPPVNVPLKVVKALLFPTLRATAAGVAAVLLSASVPVPCRPPKVAAVVPKAKAPLPLVSKVLPERAAVLARSKVPLLSFVTPVYVFVLERVSVPPVVVYNWRPPVLAPLAFTMLPLIVVLKPFRLMFAPPFPTVRPRLAGANAATLLFNWSVPPLKFSTPPLVPTVGAAFII